MITLTIRNPSDETTTFDKIRIYRSTSETGSYSLIGTIDISSGTSTSYVDTDGTSSHWYKVTYYNSITTKESDFSDPQQGGVSDWYIFVQTDLDYLIGLLRIHLGDTDVDNLRYSTSILRTALVAGLKALGPRWKYRYSIDSSYNVSRNHTFLTFTLGEPPVIQYFDEYPIVLMASILIKSGVIQESSWNVGSWADDEIRYSNIQAASSRDESLVRDIALLDSIIPPRGKKLARTSKQSLPGFTEALGNLWEAVREP